MRVRVLFNDDFLVALAIVSQPPGRPGINYTGLREVLLEFVILVF